MQEHRIRRIISAIKRFELTADEREFIAFAERNANQRSPLMKKIEIILEGIYWQKTKFIRDSIISMLKQNSFRPARTRGKGRLSFGRF